MFTTFFHHSGHRDEVRGACGTEDSRGDFGRHERGAGRHGHGPWGRPGFGPAFGGGARERLFDSGELQYVILKFLAERPSYGYELIKAIEERLAGGYAPSPGVVYPTLTLLEERGLAEVVSSEGNRKTYGITEAGKQELADNQARLDAIFDRIEHSGRRFGRERSPEIMRAFHNLGEAVRARMFRADNLTPEQVTKIAQAISEAARTIDTI